jgi:hypothetical protein
LTVPKGPVWQKIRADSLDSIPGGAQFPYSAPRPLSSWYRTGYYKIIRSSGTGLDMLCAPDEIGAALLADAEYFMDHAAEHHAILASVRSLESWHSPCWTVVTAYYWAFFCAVALTRLLGRTIWYLDKEATNFLNGLTYGSSHLRPGAFRLHCEEHLNSMERRLQLSRTKGRLHEVVWEKLFNYICGLYAVCGDQNADQLEYRLFSTLTTLNGRLGTDWPSAIRNVINYYPGCAYTEVRRITAMDSIRFIRRLSPESIADVISDFESEVIGLQSIGQVKETPAPFARLVVLLAIVLDTYCHELYAELFGRRSFDRRWSNARLAFFRTSGVMAQDSIWPYKAAH